MTTMQVRINFNGNVACMYARGPKITHYLGLDATCLCCLQMPNIEFDKEFDEVLDYSQAEFAQRYTRDTASLKMIPISGTAVRVLTGILKGQSDEAVLLSLTHLENSMAEETTFRKPDGPVAQIHSFLDKKLEQIKAGKVSRKELIDALVEKKFSAGTVTTQCGVWAKTNGVTFVRPSQAAEAKTVARKKAAKKTVKAKAA
jgi:hypothetical protein